MTQEIKNKEIQKFQKKIKQYNSPEGKKHLEKDIQKKSSGLYDELKNYNEDKESFQLMFKHADKLIIKNEKDNLYQFKSFETLKKEAQKSHQNWIKETNYGKSFQVQKRAAPQAEASNERVVSESSAPSLHETINRQEKNNIPLALKDKKVTGGLILLPLLLIGIIVWKKRN